MRETTHRGLKYLDCFNGLSRAGGTKFGFMPCGLVLYPAGLLSAEQERDPSELQILHDQRRH